MPVIARFYGILIKMYFREHSVPHFHALYGEYNAVFDVETLEAIEGDLPGRAYKLVQERNAPGTLSRHCRTRLTARSILHQAQSLP